ncbi:alpha/beta hydrolase family protein [Streptomyces sp. CA-294286]|uniref:alpha/beta hydrolase family protein n=1 Tax=Streptomyces sp. CA-294286 TaxID=3240070 RepID=UPI003D8AFD8C
MNRNRRLVASAAALVTLVLGASAVPTGAAAAVEPGPKVASSATAPLRLPAPTGAFAVGRQELHLVDRSRTDAWVPSAGARELMVSLYYPARPGTGSAVSPYLKVQEAQALLDGLGYAKVIAAEELAETQVNSRVQARPLGGKRPLVLLSPGFTLHRATLTVLAEELAGRGYVVAVMDHAYESFGTEFPGGRTLGLHAPLTKDVPEVRAADASFVIDRLLDRRGPFAGIIDRRRIGMGGHSIGGSSSAVAMARDSRIKAGVNMDGGFKDANPGAGMNGRPFLLLGTEANLRPGAGSHEEWLKAWAGLDGWKRWLAVAESGHFSFNDVPVLGGQRGLVSPQAPLPGKRGAEITRDYVGAFFDRHLKGEREPLLDGPTAANPEVSFHRP